MFLLWKKYIVNWIDRHITQQGGFNRKWIVNSKPDPAFCTTSRTRPQPMYFVFRIQIQVSATQESRSNGIWNTFLSDRAVGANADMQRTFSARGTPLIWDKNSWTFHSLLQVPEIVRTQDTVVIQLSSFHALIGWMPRCWSPFPRKFIGH